MPKIPNDSELTGASPRRNQRQWSSSLRLEAEDIPVRIEGNHGDAIFGGFASVTGSRVLVPEDLLAEAELLVDALSEGELDDDPDPASSGAEAHDGADEFDRDERNEDHDDLPDRLSPAMRRYASMWSWPILAILGAVRLGMGHYESGATVPVFALLAARRDAVDELPDHLLADHTRRLGRELLRLLSAA